MDSKIKYLMIAGLMLLSAYAGHWLTIKNLPVNDRDLSIEVIDNDELLDKAKLKLSLTQEGETAIIDRKRLAAKKNNSLEQNREQLVKSEQAAKSNRDKLLSRFQQEFEDLALQSARIESREREAQNIIYRASKEQRIRRLISRKMLSNNNIHLVPVGDIYEFSGFEHFLPNLVDIKTDTDLNPGDFKDKEVLLIWWEGHCDTVCGNTLINMERIFSKQHLSGFVPVFIQFEADRKDELKTAVDNLRWLVTFPITIVDPSMEREVRRLLGPSTLPLAMMVNRNRTIAFRLSDINEDFSSLFARTTMRYLNSPNRLQLVEESKLAKQREADFVAQQP